jgi:hypothetical protein
MPDQLNGFIEAIEANRKYQMDLEKLALDLRKMAFYPLIPEPPQFLGRVKTISLEMRKYGLKCAKQKPTTEDVIASIGKFRQELMDLIGKYVAPYSPVTTAVE